jgi:hypothetical protein
MFLSKKSQSRQGFAELAYIGKGGNVEEV